MFDFSAADWLLMFRKKKESERKLILLDEALPSASLATHLNSRNSLSFRSCSDFFSRRVCDKLWRSKKAFLFYCENVTGDIIKSN